MTAPVPQDTPTHRATVDQLPEDIALQLLETIRKNRLATFHIYTETQEMKRQAKAHTVTLQLERRLRIMDKKLEAAKTAELKARDEINKVKSLRLELEQGP